jgi:hypothetical protein
MKWRYLVPLALTWLTFGCVVFYDSTIIARAVYCWPMMVLIFISDTDRLDRWREDSST